MSDSKYPRFCPIAMAASLLEPRWTMLVLSEMWSGSTRFNEIQRGVPGMSPGLLSKRLKEMEVNNLIVRRNATPGGHSEYFTTPLVDELEELINNLGEWAHRNIDSAVSLKYLDARMLMWNIRRKIDLLQLPKGTSVIQFILNDALQGQANYWIISKPGSEPDLCYTDPKFDVDLFVVGELRAMTSAWMGHSTFEKEIETGAITLTGHELMQRTLTKWLKRSCYASLPSLAEDEASTRVV